MLSRYLDGIMIRTFAHSDVEMLAEYGSIPIINGLTDWYHPCQVLADLMTIREYKKDLKGLKLAYIGDGNNMANSLIVGGLKMGMSVSVACPNGYRPLNEVLSYAQGKPFTMTDDPMAAVEGADAVFTDVWTSMGQEAEVEARKQAFAGYCVNEALMARAKPRVHGAALPARAPGRGNHVRGIRISRRPDLRRGGKPTARAEGGHGDVDEVTRDREETWHIWCCKTARCLRDRASARRARRGANWCSPPA